MEYNNKHSSYGNKYVIYENDLKFRESRNLDLNKIDWNKNDIKHLYNIDHDSIEYRVSEFQKSGGSDLDLADMKLIKIPDIIYSNLSKFINLKHLFLSNNDLKGVLNLSNLHYLELVDVDNNKITNIILPPNLLEFSCNNNLLESLPSLNKIKRLRLSNNKINLFNNFDLNKEIEIIELDNNNITSIDLFNYNNLYRCILFNNPLTQIKISKNLKYLDISETKLIELDNINNIEHLVTNNCNYLTNIPISYNLKTLEIINTPINKLYFYKNFELIILQLNLTKNISSKYKSCNANIQIRKNIFLVISKGIQIQDEL